MTNVNKYKAQRDMWIDRIYSLQVVAQSSTEDENFHGMFKMRYEDLPEIRKGFQENHNRIIELISATQSPAYDIEQAILKKFDDCVYSIKIIYYDLFEKSKINRHSSPSSNNSSSHSNVKLPKIDIPKFDGKLKEWPTFIHLFSKLVDSNDDLSNAEKFHFLLLSLSNSPLSIVKALHRSDDNYPIAFNALKERYQNPKLLANTYWQEIMDFPKIKGESASSLRDFLDCINENLEALKALKLPVDSWDFILFSIVIKKLDQSTVTRFELENASTDLPSYKVLKTFLGKQCTALESVEFSSCTKSKTNFSQNSGHSNNKIKSSCFLSTDANNSNCSLCKSMHPIHKCQIFLEKSPFARFQVAKQKHLCLNCLQPSHKSSACPVKTSCSICRMKHSSLLHYAQNPRVSNIVQPTNTSESNERPASTSEPGQFVSSRVDGLHTSFQVECMTSSVSPEKTVLLATSLVEIEDGRGQFQIVRALIDSASQVSFITEKCCKRLGLSRSAVEFSIHGLDGMSMKAQGATTCAIRPKIVNGKSMLVDAIILKKICENMPRVPVSIPDSHFSDICLADPGFDTPTNVDMLLGADVFPAIVRPGVILGNEKLPSALNTIFGWVVMGKVDYSPIRVKNSFFTCDNSPIETVIKRFWQLEEVPHVKAVSPEDSRCEELFLETMSRDKTGRFVVALPFKGSEPTFEGSRSIALRRFYALERRLLRDTSLYKSYVEFMEDYLMSDHMEEVRLSLGTNNNSYYIPHHCVIKPESTTTKLRVVFDASCKVGGTSLNDTLLAGPKLQKDIFRILLKFRIHRIVFTADIKQMYRQIGVQVKHQDYQKILWRFTPTGAVKEYRLKTVTYGVSSAPFLALRCIQQLALEEKQVFPEASQILSSDIFVDDIVSGCDDIEEAFKLQAQLIALLQKGGFQLRKWASNCKSLLENLPVDYRHQQVLTFENGDSSSIKILGLKWIPSLDVFGYNVEPFERPCTKRTILSELARIFDPLGFLAPVSFLVKHLIQFLWTLGIDWNDEPPENVVGCWNKLKSEIPLVSNISISRCYFNSKYTHCTICGFCDSSEKGYAGVVYLRTIDDHGHINVSLICAKTKVSPLIRVSIPRLELCGAALLANLMSIVLETLSNSLIVHQIYAWSDSMVALDWIQGSPHQWKTFVSNRVSYIQERIAPSHWRHVKSSENPADCASRGLMPSDLINHHLWFSGPTWLKQPQDKWPISSKIEKGNALVEEERRIITLSFLVSCDSIDTILQKFSSLNKIERIVAYCLRWKTKQTGPFDQFELHRALLYLVKYVQSNVFKEDIQKIHRGELLSKSLRKLSPFIDDAGILRVGGRLVNSNLSFEQKHPILLPRDSRLTLLLIEDCHKANLNPGHQTLHYLLRQNFWILGSKRVINSVLSRCHRCFRLNPKPFQPLMGNLPSLRVRELKPFSCVGVDFGGPFTITLGKVRGAKTQKAYLCLFICFATKAVHLELAVDLSTEAFLRALRRFIARRGRCSQIFSDCGTNFIGASKYILELMKGAIEIEKITFMQNPASAPHFGGLWEAGIKSVKSRLLHIVGDQIFTYEELSTAFIQIESVLNSRPICAISSDPNDLNALTPGHFLCLEPLTTLPDPDLTHVTLNRLSRWQLVLRLHQDFWKRWHHEYLNTLMQRQKWTKDDSKVVPGTLVIIKDDNTPPLKWRLGRITEVHPGSDNVCRVATVKVGQGVIKRPLVKLCPLPNQAEF